MRTDKININELDMKNTKVNRLPSSPTFRKNSI